MLRKVLYFLPLLLWFFLKRTNFSERVKESIYLFSVLLVIFVDLSFADLTNLPDVVHYNYMYSYLTSHSIMDFYKKTDLEYFEYGFVAFAKFLTYFSSSYRFLYIARGLVTVVIFYLVIKKYSANVFLSGVVAFLFSAGFDQATYVIRQYMAISIFLLSIEPILNKQLIKYLIIFLFAFSFHRSVAVLFPLYFVYNYLHIEKWGVLKIAIFIGIPTVFAYSIIQAFSLYFNLFSSYFITTDVLEEELGSAGMAMRASFVLIPFFFVLDRVKSDPKGMLWFITACLSLIFAVGMIGIPAGSRLFPCYNYFSMLTIPWVYENFPKKYKRLFLIGIVAVFIFLFIHELPLMKDIPFVWEK